MSYGTVHDPTDSSPNAILSTGDDVATDDQSISRKEADWMVSFYRDDPGYQAWTNSNEHDGWVGNVYTETVAVHRANCPQITGTPANGSRWTYDYAKWCSLDRQELETRIVESGRAVTEGCYCLK
jgi:hypothetical protein